MLLLLARYLDASRPLNILDCTPTSAQVALSLDELVILNEAANGVHISDWEFATCVGSNRAEVQTLLCAVGDCINRMNLRPDLSHLAGGESS